MKKFTQTTAVEPKQPDQDEEYGLETPQGFVKPPKGLLTKSTINYYLKAWGYDRV